MRRFQLSLAWIALPVFACSLFLVGCGKSGDKKNENTENEPEKTKPSGPLTVQESKGGVLKGKITLKSPAPVDKLDASLLKAIDDKKDQKDFCLSAKDSSEKTEQTYRIGDNKQLGNVFVWIRPDAGHFFKVDEKQLEEAKKHKLVIHQPHCAFIPHCSFAFVEYHPDSKEPKKSQPTGLLVEVTNDATVSHNTKWSGGSRAPNGNVTIDPKSNRPIEKLVADSTTPLTLRCIIHPWMDAYMWAVDTPYHAISYSDTLDGENKVKKDDPKFGTYEIKNLPVGKVRVLAWHEDAGWLNKDRKGDLIEIKAGTPYELNFEVEPK